MRSLLTQCTRLLIMVLTVSLPVWSQPRLRVEPGELDFEPLPLGLTAEQSLTFRNEGQERLIFSGSLDSPAFTTNLAESQVPWAVEAEPHHFRWIRRYPDNHSILILQAQWNGHSLALGDEIAVFDPRRVCEGGAIITEIEGMVGLAAWGADPDNLDAGGFRDGESFEFWFWDPVSERAVEAEPTFVDGQREWHANGFTVITLAAQGEICRQPGEVWLGPDEEVQVQVRFNPPEANDYESDLIISSNDPERRQVNIHITGRGVDNQPPVWVRIPAEFTVHALEFIEFEVIVSDPDSDEVDIRLRPGDLPDRADFFMFRPNVGIFQWQTEIIDTGEHLAYFSVSDGIFTVNAEVPLYIERAHIPPPRPIPDLQTWEDWGRVFLVDLSDYFIDYYDDAWRCQLTINPPLLGLEIDDQKCLFADPRPDYWNAFPGEEVRIRGVHPEGHQGELSFFLLVRSVNDLPEPFDILTPPNHYLFGSDPGDSAGTVTFMWSAAPQNIYEIDGVAYRLYVLDREGWSLQAWIGIDTTTTLTVERLFQLVPPEQINHTIRWQVEAIDGSGGRRMASNAPFSLDFTVGVKDVNNPVLPMVPILQPVWPNPLNGQGFVVYALPPGEAYELALFDLRGRLVKILDPGYAPGWGWRQKTIDTKGLVSGGYIVRLKTRDEAIIQTITVEK